MTSYPLPVCPDCGERIEATVCGIRPASIEAMLAIDQVLIAMHRRIAHGAEPPPNPHRYARRADPEEPTTS